MHTIHKYANTNTAKLNLVTATAWVSESTIFLNKEVYFKFTFSLLKNSTQQD